VSPKNIAGLLNNESNLRILEKLKVRAYYPRELAGEMKLNESFVVRRLKAMEECDIVEGRWESEGSRKVKRYYLKDVTMQLGKGGLEVTTGEAMTKSAAKSEISLRKEALGLLIILPIFLLAIYGSVTSQPVLIVAVGLLFAWQIADNLAFYRNYRYSTLVVGAFILALCILSQAFILAMEFAHVDLISQTHEDIGLMYMAWGIIFLAAFAYYIRFSQVEARDLTADKKDFISGLDSASASVKIFYLPMVFRWKINEYFGLI
jgi:hypothetical protein